jgi:hypothetical protein
LDSDDRIEVGIDRMAWKPFVMDKVEPETHSGEIFGAPLGGFKLEKTGLNSCS